MAELLDEKSIISRIKILRENHSGKRGKALFAKSLGISPSTYNYYEKDRLPPVEVLWNICRLTDTDMHWLLSGSTNNENFDTPHDFPTPLMSKIKALIKQDPQANQALAAFVNLCGSKINLENSLTNSKSNTYVKNKKSLPHPPWLPVLGRTAAGIINYWDNKDGQLPDITEFTELISRHQNRSYQQHHPQQISTDLTQPDIMPLDHKSVSLVQLNEVDADGICEFIESAEILSRYPDAFALRVDGDSMAPRIQDADIIVLSPSVPARDGAAAVIKLQQQIGVTCKIIRRQGDQIHLIAANERFDTKIVNQDQIIWSLTVLWRIRLP